MRKLASLLAVPLVLLLLLAACSKPAVAPDVRNIDGQKWVLNTETTLARLLGFSLEVPLELTLKFQQDMYDVKADATLAYPVNISIFPVRLPVGTYRGITGTIDPGARLVLGAEGDTVTFDGKFGGDLLVGDLKIDLLEPLPGVTFERAR